MKLEIKFMLAVLVMLSWTGTLSAANLKYGETTIFDPHAGMIWQSAAREEATWLEAVHYCNQLELAGMSAWRLPTKEELTEFRARLLNDLAGGGFSGAPEKAGVFWSLSRDEQDQDLAWAVSFDAPVEFRTKLDQDAIQVRCLIETVEAVYLPFLSQWAQAWSAQDFAAYSACYGRDFRPEDGLSRARWLAERQQRLSAPEFIQVSLSDVKIVSEDDDQANVMFLQSYRSDHYQDQVIKVLTLKIENERLVISGEKVLSSIR